MPIIPGRDVLGYGEYGLMASTAGYIPESPADEAVTIALWGDVDVMPFVYLGWKATG